MTEEIKEGDLVRLKSGGPKMTVDSVNGNNEVKCCFFNENEPEWITYPSHTLKKIDS